MSADAALWQTAGMGAASFIRARTSTCWFFCGRAARSEQDAWNG